MQFKTLFLATAAVISLASTADARPADITYWGIGASPCGTWSPAREMRQSFAYEQWVLGYVVGITQLARDEDDPLRRGDPPELIFRWIDRVCTGSPLTTLHQAVMGVVKTLGFHGVDGIKRFWRQDQ
jgi:hypothetical protein